MNNPMPADPQAAIHLAEFGKLIGISRLQLDTTGCCQLTFDKRWLVTLIYLPQTRQWRLSCFLAASSELISGNVQSAMLRANFLGSGCAGGCLAVSPDGRPSLEFQLPDNNADGNVLLAAIENLLDQAEIWGERIQRNESSQVTGAPPP